MLTHAPNSALLEPENELLPTISSRNGEPNPPSAPPLQLSDGGRVPLRLALGIMLTQQTSVKRSNSSSGVNAHGSEAAPVGGWYGSTDVCGATP